MEPFSLFQLFQSLCNNTPPPQDAPPPKSEPVEPPPEIVENTSSQEAFLQFLTEHDARAKRKKKP